MKKVKQNNFKYPIVAFSKSAIHLARNSDEILVCTKTALKNNFYKNMKIVDSAGILYKVNNAIKLKGHGFLWGYNIFLNQKVDVELVFTEDPILINIEDLKKMLLSSLKGEFWRSGDNHSKIIKEVENTTNFHHIIKYLEIIYYNLE
ncbi:hypothetical protein [Flavobacterium lipolyticum]|uniref:Uncharacterized protein n=1 Tax=Flavobacterium lipolyticum TaxID=2893754 RepID=A0ABS8M6A3_9FLAO|nr:hypothetical protein [Flavobacterium sp. F-126]MCC9019748.1 hypothetical protein [Flavobacterium sp. F-126]